jgi:hypothetical protein
MTDRPTTPADWATSGVNVVAPPSGKTTDGWLSGERPPAGFFNWWQNLVGTWIDWLTEQADAATSRLNGAAYLAAANIFARVLQVDSADDPLEPLLTTTKTAHDYVANPSNGWKRVLQFPCDATGRTVSVYVGANDPSGMLAITVNAVWHLSDSKWRQESAAAASFALMVIGEQLVLSQQGAGASPWSTWPKGAIQASLAQVDDSIFAGNAIATSGDFNYSPPKTRTDVVRLGTAMIGGHDAITGALLGGSGTTPNVIDLAIPPNATLGFLDVLFYQATTAPSSFQFCEMEGVDWTTPGPLSAMTVLANQSGPSSSGYYKVTLDLTGVTLDHAKEYRLRWAPGTGTDAVLAVRMRNWSDGGPRSIL